MTNMRTHRRSPFIILLIFIVVVTASLLLVAVLQFDIGAYRQELATQLEKTFKKPVQLGDIELRFHSGIALDFSELQIGDNDNFRLHVPLLSATLDPWRLLHGEIIIKQLLIDAPELKLKLPLVLTPSTFNLDRFGVKTLQIREGKLDITPEDSARKSTQTDHFNLILHGLGQGRVNQLTTTASIHQNGQTSELELSLELTRHHSLQDWRQEVLIGNFFLSNLHLSPPSKQNLGWFNTPITLSAAIKGIPADKVSIDALISDTRNEANHFQLLADWQSFTNKDQFSYLRLGHAEAPLRGQIELTHLDKEPQLTGQLTLPNTKINALLKGLGLPVTKLSGQVDEFKININGPLHSTLKNPFAPLQTASLSLKDLSYTYKQTRLQNLHLDLKLTNAKISLNKGQGSFEGIPFTFSGSSGPLTQKPLDLTFKLQSDLSLEQLQQRYPTPFSGWQKLRGIAPLNLEIAGPATNLTTHLEIDLTQTELTFGKLLDKKLGVPSRIDLAGHLVSSNHTLEHLQIDLDQARIEATGQLTKEQQNWRGELSFSPITLENLQSSSPIFEHFNINGQAQGQLELTPTDWRSQVKLSQAGAHLTPLIADLNRVETTLKLDRKGIDFGQMKGRLGLSPIRISGELTNWRGMLIALRVTSKEVRAQDLIFTNQQMKLQNLDGKLLINAGGITFDPILVTVENRTTVSVAGQMRGYKDPQTYLEIESDDADIIDVIHLFTGPQKLHPQPHRTNNAAVRIEARVKKGQLGSFMFEDATGTINDRHHLFTLDPLQFKLGQGQAAGRVELDRERNNLLKISGHAQNCDADRVYEMFFEKKGIFRGDLSGDFYIEGEKIGETFWKTSHGGGHLRIKDGAMRELNGFAQIFSLLNVSQLFKFRLPDMDKEGLPLSMLKSSVRITDGILYFDDFKITSPAINISAVGQLNTLEKTIDSTVGIKPLRTVDIILSNVPLFGWVLTGDEEALITALFTLKGPVSDPKVAAAPVSSVAQTALGIIGRALGLPFRMLKKTGEFLTTPPRPEDAAPEQPPAKQTP